MRVGEAFGLLAVAVGLAGLVGASTGLVVVNAPPLVVPVVMLGAVPLGALGALAHVRAFTPPHRPPVRRSVAADQVRYEVDGTASTVGIGLAVWLTVVATDAAVTVWASTWAVPMGTFGLLYSLGALDAVRRIRPRVAVTIGLHQVVVQRAWLPGWVRVQHVGAERVQGVSAVVVRPGTAALVLTTSDHRTILGMEGPAGLVEQLAAEVTQITLRPRGLVGAPPSSLAVLVDRARQGSPG